MCLTKSGGSDWGDVREQLCYLFVEFQVSQRRIDQVCMQPKTQDGHTLFATNHDVQAWKFREWFFDLTILDRAETGLVQFGFGPFYETGTEFSVFKFLDQ